MSRGLAAGQSGEVAARRLLSGLEPCTRNQMLLANLDRLQNESRFRNLAAWVSTQGDPFGRPLEPSLATRILRQPTQGKRGPRYILIRSNNAVFF